jgi:hypothetical protein
MTAKKEHDIIQWSLKPASENEEERKARFRRDKARFRRENLKALALLLRYHLDLAPVGLKASLAAALRAGAFSAGEK